MTTHQQQSILIVGGAGYIGSHMVDFIKRAGFYPVVLDNLSTGHRDAVIDAEFIHGDLEDPILLDEIFAKHTFAGVMHFASFIQVGESVKDPAKYYQNNFAATLSLLQAMLKWKVQHFIFSSTAAVYGEPQYTPIDELHPLAPINPYGRSKWMVEQVLKDYAASYGFKYAVLRYFNAAGADPAGRFRERHDPETHLIPLVLEVAQGKRKAITVYGNDYSTKDGTCVRDYIHVTDLCAAHLLALQQLWDGANQLTYNLGTGEGYSVRQVIDTAKAVTGRDIPVIQGERRAGDPAVLVADAKQAMKELGWSPKYSSLRTIIEHAWNVAQPIAEKA
ncbi:MAG: UDP-glucose 4-epimerase GalE [Gammaproteobacteria bacterium]|nr:UDP-glucose 4-epimerase GalE [Gammaproteobacteria bacterium]